MQKRKNIVIIGGGPSGLEAARILSDLGYAPFLIEKESYLGGHLAKWDRLFPTGEKAKDILDRLTGSLENVKWFVNTRVNSINKLDRSFNILLSNGVSIIADTLLLTTGFQLFQAEKKEEYGYGIYDSVITNADLENYFSEGDKNAFGDLKDIGFVHCVGSRDEKVGNRHCSKVCCATAVKQACEMKQLFPHANIYCFYMDLRMFGRYYEDMYLQAQKDYGIQFVRGRLSEVGEGYDGRLVVKAEDTLSSKPIKVSLDLLVLMAGMTHDPETDHIARMLSVPIAEDGFLKSKDNIYSVHKSSTDGLFYAGACTGPKTLPESLAEARAAAMEIHDYLMHLK